MRIISGSRKGRKLSTPPPRDRSIRPTSDRAREALFNILGERARGARVLDLFAGTGALGLEAFSRGAASVVFVDFHRLALELINKNILRCLTGDEESPRLRVISHDLCRGLPLKKLTREAEGGFDIIFADPPYAKNISLAVLDALNNNMLLAEDGLLVMEERSDVILPNRPGRLRLADRRVYGDTAFWMYVSDATGQEQG